MDFLCVQYAANRLSSEIIEKGVEQICESTQKYLLPLLFCHNIPQNFLSKNVECHPSCLSFGNPHRDLIVGERSCVV
ncbi:MAG: hypothetical protein OXC30_02440 [Alphaproteobacteria bacterium]|nr:hypothetical protein [Alphaproteobacteria bacterium]